MFAALVDDLTGRSIDVLDNALAAAKAKRDQADLEIAAITAVVDSNQAFQDHGHRTVTGYLKQQLNCSAGEARRIKSRGRLFNQHPDIGDALGSSRIGVSQIDLLADAQQHRVAGQRFTEFAPLLTEQAEQLEYTDFKIAVKHFTTQADPDGSFDDQQFQQDHRTASVTVHDGAISVHASGGDPLRATEMKAVFDRALDVEFDKDCVERRRLHGDDALAHPLPRTTDQRKFDAMYEMFMSWTTVPAGGVRPEPLVNIVIDPTTAIDTLIRHGLLDDITNTNTNDTDSNDTDSNGNDTDSNGDGEGVATGPVDPSTQRCATSTGTQVHPDVAMRAMLRGHVRHVMVDAHDVVINMGRKQRLFTGKARAAAQLLAIRCGHRGCDVPAEFCDIDHIDEHAASHGDTNQANALPLCGVHNRWKHARRLRGRRDTTGRVHLIRPDGTVIKALGARDPIWADTNGSMPDIEPATGSEPTGDLAPPNDPAPHDGPESDMFDAPVRTTTWSELTKNSTSPSRHSISPDAVVQLIDLRVA